jgi:polyisoprenoid-binding protein YceI
MTQEMNISTNWTDKDWDKFSEWLKGMLKVSEGTVTFTKADGTERVMKCTLNPEQLPKVEIKEDAKPRKESTTSMRVFDLEKNEWRSFTIKNVKQVNFTIE